MGPDTMTKDNKVVLFADIVGFAELIESCPLDIDGLRSRETIPSALYADLEPILSALNADLKRVLSGSSADMSLDVKPNRLTHVFSAFHDSLGWQLYMARLWHPLTAITFSDSAFIATTYLHESVNIATDLLDSLLPQKIPVRIGVAYGSFAALRFRSDISVQSGDHAAHFLGQSVVRAHIADMCGIKGIRILLHPSVMPLLDDIQHNPQQKEGVSNPFRILKCSDNECANKVGVTHEINYWLLKPAQEARAWHGLQDMWNQAPPSAVEHYEATAQAIDRMRIARGCKPLKKLRRRTLPR